MPQNFWHAELFLGSRAKNVMRMRVCFVLANKMAAASVLPEDIATSLEEPSSPSLKSRGKMWSNEATIALIELWSEETIQFSLENCKTSRETGEVYKTLLVSTSTIYSLH